MYYIVNIPLFGSRKIKGKLYIISVTRLEDLVHFGQLFKALGNN